MVRSKLTAPSYHLMGGKPDAQIHEPDQSAAISPPHETKLLDDEKTKSSMGLFRFEFWIGSCSHVASLV